MLFSSTFVPFVRFFSYYPLLLLASISLLLSSCKTPFISPDRQVFEPALVAPLPVAAATPAPPLFNTEVLQIQILLDDRDIGPGVVDGRMGSITEKAKQEYEALYAPITADALGHITPFSSYEIRKEDLARIGTMAATPQGIARQKNTPYTELIDFVAERYHTSRAFLKKINPGVNFDQLLPGDSVKVPDVSHPFQIENYAPGTTRTPNFALKNRMVEIDTERRLLKVFNGNRIIAIFPITPGSKELPAPVGTWKIQGIAGMPWYRYDKGVLDRGVRTDNFYMYPPGPRSPVGVLFVGLNKPGIGIHGTNKPETIGRSASHGCIRLSNWDAARFREMVTVGNPVIIR